MNVNDNALILDLNEIDSFKESSKILVEGKEISALLLSKLILFPSYYEYVLNIFKNNIDKLDIRTINNKYISLTKLEIFLGISYLVNNKMLMLGTEEKNRLDILQSFVNKDLFWHFHKNKNYSFNIENENYIFETSQLFDILNISDEKFNNLNRNIANDKRIMIIYEAVIIFFENYLPSNGYVIPDNMNNRYKDIKEIVEIKKYEYTEELKKLRINSELKNGVLAGIKDNYSDLEKAIYTYIKMCRLLSYDEELYVKNKSDDVVEKHLNINLVSDINLLNNEVECLQFSTIYSKILNDLNIKNRIDTNNLHYKVKFLSDEFIIEADSTNRINGDLINAKLFNEIKGISCINTDDNIKEKFLKILNNVYSDIKNDNKNDNVLPYLEKINDYKNLDLNSKFEIFINSLSIFENSTMDNLAWILYLRKRMFNSDELTNNFKVYFMKKNENDNVSVNAIFYLNNNGDINYYYYIPNNSIQKIDRNDLQELINNGVLSYIKEENERILGIEESKKGRN